MKPVLFKPGGGPCETFARISSVFANEDDLRDSEPVLKEMNPPEGLGSRGATDIYEVAADVRS